MGRQFQLDYSIYTWPLMEQIDLKLSICNNALNISIDIEADKALYLYPNPTNGILNIQIENWNKDFSVTIFNQVGETIFKSIKQKLIDVKNFAKGIYFVTIRTNQ
jgi:hypothetical protein